MTPEQALNKIETAAGFLTQENTVQAIKLLWDLLPEEMKYDFLDTLPDDMKAELSARWDSE